MPMGEMGDYTFIGHDEHTMIGAIMNAPKPSKPPVLELRLYRV